jgi:Ca2+-binding RTX toxin-like protein
MRWFLKKKSRRARPVRAPRFGAGLESLEDRKLMAADLGGFTEPAAEVAAAETAVSPFTLELIPSVSLDTQTRTLKIIGTDEADRRDHITVDHDGQGLIKVSIRKYDTSMNLLYEDFRFFTTAGVQSISFQGRAGDDTIFNNTNLALVASGGDGNDLLYGGSGFNYLMGDRGNDSISGGAAADYLFGGEGNDWIHGLGGNDSIYGGAGADRLLGGAGDDSISGEAGNDTLEGHTGNDVLYGGDGADVLHGDFAYATSAGGHDVIYAGAGNDVVYGGVGNDVIYGDAGNDILLGNEGNDRIYGGAGDDVLFGGAGNDRLDGGHGGFDQRYGGTGADVFVNHKSVFGLDDNDPIHDFSSSEGDSIDNDWHV